MSGFLVTRRPDADCSFIARRGRDVRHGLEIGGFHCHWFLTCTGAAFDPRSLVDGDVAVFFDGALYDLPAGVGTGARLVELYRTHGDDFAGHLDGDFAVAIYDFGRRTALLVTDPFGTKPLFARGAECASYPSGLGGADGAQRMAPNTLRVVDLDDGFGHEGIVKPFDFDHQPKDGYDDCVAAFEQAVRRRAVAGCYLPLSAGYDSGAIDCALARLGVDYKSWSIVGEENVELLRRRNPRGEILDMDLELFAEHKDFLRRHAETSSFRQLIVSDEGDERIYDPLEDNAASGLSWIHSRARAEGRKVSLSGTGAEILSALKGRWPETLRPWSDFDGRMGTAWLAKEEVAAGAHGVEVRYPFYDRTLVQEFLWLTPERKNRFYKAPLHVYMTEHGYPFDQDVKTGFIPLPEDD